MDESSKKVRLLSSAYKLFITKGFNKTTIQDIVDAARVAKGTFYLYFEDKYKLQEELIIHKSDEIFNNAVEELNKSNIKDFSDQVIYVIDYIIDTLVIDPSILNFVSKDLALGVYQEKITNILGSEESKIYSMFITGAKENKIQMPEATLFIIFELFSSTIYSVLTRRIDITIDDYKNMIHVIIKNLLSNKKGS